MSGLLTKVGWNHFHYTHIFLFLDIREGKYLPFFITRRNRAYGMFPILNAIMVCHTMNTPFSAFPPLKFLKVEIDITPLFPASYKSKKKIQSVFNFTIKQTLRCIKVTWKSLVYFIDLLSILGKALGGSRAASGGLVPTPVFCLVIFSKYNITKKISLLQKRTLRFIEQTFLIIQHERNFQEIEELITPPVLPNHGP